ncbi:MAG: transposase [Bacteroidetes bacterium]|jgi:putative transposase|nr:transposase [Bacteroidota bacterium]MDF1868299.1 transposase [Saprospiraceae bacterium]
MKKRSWNKEEKLKILKEAKSEGVQITLRKYGVYPATYYSWRKKYLVEGEAGIEDTASRRKAKKYIRKLGDDVGLLKQLLAERDLEIALRDDLLKKASHPHCESLI